MRARRALLALWISALLATRASAQASDADKLYVEGVKLLKKGDVAGAVERFELAAEVQKSAPLLFNLGQALAKLGRFSDARRVLVEARDLAQASGPESIVPLAKSALEEVEARLPRVVVELPPGLANARVDLDGKRIAITADGVVVDPGRHTLTVAADGYETFEEGFTVKEGDRRRIRPELEKREATTPGRAEAPKVTQGKPSLVGPLVLGGVGVLSLGGAAYFYLSMGSTEDERRALWEESGCPGPSCPSGEPARAAELREDAEGKALLGNVLLGVGAAALIGGGVWYFLSSKPKRQEGAALYVLPAPGGAIVGGRL